MTETKHKTLRDSAALRWVAMILISGLMFATYYFQDFYSGLRDLLEVDFGINSEQFGRMLGLTTIANWFGMIIVGGIILDKWGIRLAGFVFAGIATLGGLISALTASEIIFQDNTLLGLILGRVFFGIGLEVCCVISMRTIVKWFKGYEVALAMGINMGFGRLGSALAIAISFDIAGGTVSPAVTFAATLIGISFIMFAIYTLLDYKIDQQDKRVAEPEAEGSPETAAQAKADTSEDFKFSDLVKLAKNSSFVYITLLCVAFYSAVFPFIQYAPDLLVNKFGFSYSLPEGGSVILFGSEALGNTLVYVVVFLFALGFTLIPNNINKGKGLARLIIFALFAVIVYYNRDFISVWLENGPKTAALIPLGTIIFTPIFGSMVDKKGKAASIMMLGAFLLIFAHLSISLGQHPIFAYLGLLSLGVAFSLLPAAMWPSVSKIVAENRLGTAYSTMFTIQNYGLGIFFWGIGALLLAVPVNKETKNALDEQRARLVVEERLEGEEREQRLKEVTAEFDEIANDVLVRLRKDNDMKEKECDAEAKKECNDDKEKKHDSNKEFLSTLKENFLEDAVSPEDMIGLSELLKKEIEKVEAKLTVSDTRTKEEVIEYLDNITEKILAKTHKDTEIHKDTECEDDKDLTEKYPEEYIATKELLEYLRNQLVEHGYLTGGQISQVITLMQATEQLDYYDYTIPILMLVVCGLISIFLAYKLKRADKKQGFGLELPNVDDKKDKKEEE